MDAKRLLLDKAAPGMGKTIALALAKEGALMVVNDLNMDGAKQTAEEIGAESLPFPANPVIWTL